MFNSPLGWCTVVKRWAALDETVSDCMRLQRCGMTVCPHAGHFAALNGKPAAAGTTAVSSLRSGATRTCD